MRLNRRVYFALQQSLRLPSAHSSNRSSKNCTSLASTKNASLSSNFSLFIKSVATIISLLWLPKMFAALALGLGKICLFIINIFKWWTNNTRDLKRFSSLKFFSCFLLKLKFLISGLRRKKNSIMVLPISLKARSESKPSFGSRRMFSNSSLMLYSLHF